MWVIFLVGFIVILIEKGFFPSFFPAGFIPELLLIYLLIFCNWKMKNSKEESSWNSISLVILLLGIIYDLLLGGPLGLTSLLFLLVILLLVILGAIFPVRLSLLFLPLNLILGTILVNILFYLVNTLLGNRFHFLLYEMLIKQTGVNLLVGIIISPLFNLIFNRILGRRELEID